MNNISIDILQSSDRIKIQSYTGLQILTRIVNVTGRINTGFILTGSINFWCVSLELRATIFVEGGVVVFCWRYLDIRYSFDRLLTCSKGFAQHILLVIGTSDIEL
jgi:hypothetical protein